MKESLVFKNSTKNIHYTIEFWCKKESIFGSSRKTTTKQDNVMERQLKSIHCLTKVTIISVSVTETKMIQKMLSSIILSPSKSTNNSISLFMDL